MFNTSLFLSVITRGKLYYVLLGTLFLLKQHIRTVSKPWMSKCKVIHLEFYLTVYNKLTSYIAVYKKGLTIFVAWLSKGLSFRKDNCHYEVLKAGYKKQSCVFIIFNVMFILMSLIPIMCRAGVCGIQYITRTTTQTFNTELRRKGKQGWTVVINKRNGRTNYCSS